MGNAGINFRQIAPPAVKRFHIALVFGNFYGLFQPFFDATECFKIFVNEGVVSEELLKIYEEILIKAETLLVIFKSEKKKRGEFTYQKIARANREPANQSLDNAKTFFSNIFRICSKKD